jgi:hypothetical protein
VQIIEHEEVLQSERRIREAKRRLEEITARMHAHKAAQSQPGAEQASPSTQVAAPAAVQQQAAAAGGLNPATQALVTAMATTMAAEQHEINALRRRLSRLRRRKARAHAGPRAQQAHAVVNATATCAKACAGLNGTELAHCQVDCRALAALSTLASQHPRIGHASSNTRASQARQSNARSAAQTRPVAPRVVPNVSPNLAQQQTARVVATKGGRAQEDENLAKIA